MSRYYVWQGEVFPSVTSILAVIAKPGLTRWAARRVAEAALAQADLIARLAKVDPDGAIARLEAAPWHEKNDAAALGTSLHHVAEAVAQNGRFEVPSRAGPLVGYFLNFVRERHPRFICTEVAVYSRAHAYAGTLDGIIELDGGRFLVDYKTGKAVYPEYTLQLAAYAHADFVGHPDGREEPMPTVDGAFVLHLTADGYALVPVDLGAATFEVFLAVRTLYGWLERSRAGPRDRGDGPRTQRT